MDSKDARDLLTPRPVPGPHASPTPDGGDAPARSTAGKRKTLSVLVALLAGLGVFWFLVQDREKPGSPSTATAADYGVEGKDIPGKAEVLRYLQGLTVRPNEADGMPIPGAPLDLARTTIRSLSIRHEDGFFTTATFVATTGAETYDVELHINHNPVDGTFVFDGFRTLKASKQ